MIIRSWMEWSVIGVTLPWLLHCPLTWSHGAGRPSISCKFIKMSCLPLCLSSMRKGTRQEPHTPAASSAFLLVHILSLCAPLSLYKSAFSSIGICVSHPLGVCPGHYECVSLPAWALVSVSLCLDPSLCASLSLHVWESLCVCLKPHRASPNPDHLACHTRVPV